MLSSSLTDVDRCVFHNFPNFLILYSFIFNNLKHRDPIIVAEVSCCQSLFQKGPGCFRDVVFLTTNAKRFVEVASVMMIHNGNELDYMNKLL
jgi:hypothetical protein